MAELKEENVNDTDDVKQESSKGKFSLTVAVIQRKLELHLHDTQTKYMYHGSFTSQDLQKCGFGHNQASNLEKVCKFLESARKGHHELNFKISIEKNTNSEMNDGGTGIIKITKADDFFPLEITLRLRQTPRDKIDILEEDIQDLKKENNELKNHIMPKGSIIMWSGTIDNIPKGWVLCNGQNQTPDLRNRFLIGATDKYDIGCKGGYETHKHIINVNGHALTVDEMPAHTHGLGSAYYYGGNGAHTFKNLGSSSEQKLWWGSLESSTKGGNVAHSHRATSQNSNHLPPYYAVCFIMKII